MRQFSLIIGINKITNPRLVDMHIYITFQLFEWGDAWTPKIAKQINKHSFKLKGQAENYHG